MIEPRSAGSAKWAAGPRSKCAIGHRAGHGGGRLSTVGTTTIEKPRRRRGILPDAGAGQDGLAGKPKVLELAERYKIVIVGYEPGSNKAR